MEMKKIFLNVKSWLQSLSFKTGMILLGASILCYIISFAQAALPLSLAWKGALWVVFFGLAKTFQYSALLILGKEGVARLRARLRRKASPDMKKGS